MAGGNSLVSGISGVKRRAKRAGRRCQSAPRRSAELLRARRRHLGPIRRHILSGVKPGEIFMMPPPTPHCCWRSRRRRRDRPPGGAMLPLSGERRTATPEQLLSAGLAGRKRRRRSVAGSVACCRQVRVTVQTHCSFTNSVHLYQ